MDVLDEVNKDKKPKMPKKIKADKEINTLDILATMLGSSEDIHERASIFYEKLGKELFNG